MKVVSVYVDAAKNRSWMISRRDRNNTEQTKEVMKVWEIKEVTQEKVIVE